MWDPDWTTEDQGKVGSNIPKFQKVNDPVLESIRHLKSPVQFFKLFVTDEFVEKTLEQTKLYAEQTCKLSNWKKKDRDEILSVDAIWAAIGISLVMGYNSLPARTQYWETRRDVKNLLIVETMG